MSEKKSVKYHRDHNIPVLIVAAGASRRMHVPKQLLAVGSYSMLGNAIQQAKSADCGEVLTVLGSKYTLILPAIAAFDITVLKNSEWRNGIGSSISCGVHYLLQKREDISAVLIMLADQPLVDARYLQLLTRAFAKDPRSIIATKYPHNNGVPAVFPAEYLKELALLKEDQGAKHLLNGDRAVIALDAGNKVMDIDTPDDYRQLQTKLKKESDAT